MEITRHLLFNLSLLLVILFFYLMWLERRKNMPKFITIGSFICSIFVCFLFSYQPIPYVSYDLRLIPVLIGGLYFGIGPLLTIIVIIIRAFYGIDQGFFVGLTIYGSLTFLLIKLHPWFIRQHPKRRISFSVSFAIIFSLITVLLLPLIEWVSLDFDALFAYIVVPTLGIFIFSYSVEFSLKNIRLYNRVIDSEKTVALEQMGAAIAHEIRNPLTTAIGFVQLLQETEVDQTKNQQYLSMVKQELDAAELIIKDYLIYSRQFTEQVEEIDVNQELNHVLRTLRPLAEEHSVNFYTSYLSVGTIIGNANKFRQCLSNIIKNGIESMPLGGSLIVCTQLHQSNVIIEIKDKGTGMSKEQLEQLGKPYYLTGGPKGTGLSMMVSYGIVRAMKGSIKVKSEIGNGTTFLIIFPSNHFIRKNIGKILKNY
ncbi:HAMP domain-containing histidine kinase [Niallia endozanthoxylica]|uniref:histidine kinase n=2 Tax=Niallia endozanthoxylica TaxID=2036016 RepID=A0A5J5I0B1_9BACI|nr:HAMP domain-containing histidine kinase [Niallia endozanthoxylica]